MLTAEDRKRYQNAIDATRGLVIEKKWNTAVKGTMMGEAHRNTAQDVATRVMGDYIRDQVISCGKMGDFPNPYQLQMISAFGSKEFKALQAEVQKAQAAGKQEAAMEYVMIHSVDPDFRKQLLPKDLDEKMKPKAAAREKVSLEELQKKEAPKKEEKKVHEAPEKTHEAPQVRPRSKSFPR